jgi:hypothetical protein
VERVNVFRSIRMRASSCPVAPAFFRGT